MKKVILWFFLCCKRYLKRIPFLLLLAALPLTALAASRMENGKDGTVRIPSAVWIQSRPAWETG